MSSWLRKHWSLLKPTIAVPALRANAMSVGLTPAMAVVTRFGRPAIIKKMVSQAIIRTGAHHA